MNNKYLFTNLIGNPESTQRGELRASWADYVAEAEHWTHADAPITDEWAD